MTKEDALAVILKCAKAYNENLNNNKLLFVAFNKKKGVYTYEVTFDAGNFLHLTGVKNVREKTGEKIAPNDFFERCLKNKVSIKNFELSGDGTTQLKLSVLPELMCLNLSAKMIGDYGGGNIRLYTEKVAGSVCGCIGFVNNVHNHCNYPNTVLNRDIREVTGTADRILITYRKKASDSEYSEIVYKTKGYDFSALEVPGYPYLKFE